MYSERKTGGITVTVGGASIKTITSYSVSTHINSGGSSPVSYKDFSINSGLMSETDAQTILGKAAARTATLVCPDKNGTVYISSISKELVNANAAGKLYRVSLSLTEEPISTNSVTVSGVSYDLTSCDVQWDFEKESFEKYDFSTYYIYKGRRAHISFTTVPLTSVNAAALATSMGTGTGAVSLTVDNFTGSAAIDSVSRSAVEKDGTTMYVMSVSATSVALI